MNQYKDLKHTALTEDGLGMKHGNNDPTKTQHVLSSMPFYSVLHIWYIFVLYVTHFVPVYLLFSCLLKQHLYQCDCLFSVTRFLSPTRAVPKGASTFHLISGKTQLPLRGVIETSACPWTQPCLKYVYTVEQWVGLTTKLAAQYVTDSLFACRFSL